MRTFAYFFLLSFFCACQTSQQPNIDNWSWQNFVKVDSVNPILLPTTKEKFTCPISKQMIAWSERNVLNPAAVVKEGKVWMLFRSQDTNMTSRIGLAYSDDGIHFTKQAEPVLFPAVDSMQKYEWKGGVEDPRIVETNDGRYILTYTAYDGKTARLCLASSTDLNHWTKHGLVLADEKYKNDWSKSGAIVAVQKGDKIIATQIDGKYWMYFGDTDLFMATSTDLLHWTVLENDESKKPIAVLQPRAGYFDSRLVEPGPYALLEADGIHLIYNASNAANCSDTSLPKFTYAAGQALFSKSKPFQLIDRTKNYFMKPDKNYELIGEVNNVCFLEGLVHFKSKWFLYYGTADSKIAVAVRNAHE
jgi:beta-1,2-mannosidase